MRALLLAAGLGTRLHPLTINTPKCLTPIHGKPLLEYWLNLLLSNNAIDRVLINTHHLPDQVRQFIAKSPYKNRINLVHEPELHGTGGTVLNNADFFGAQAFMVIHADNLSRFSAPDFIASHQNRPAGCAITMMTFQTDQPQNCGIVSLNQQAVVMSFHEKVASPPGNLANGAVYIFEAEVLDFMRSQGRNIIDISTEILPQFIGRIYTFHNADYHRDIGTPESLKLAEAEFTENI